VDAAQGIRKIWSSLEYRCWREHVTSTTYDDSCRRKPTHGAAHPDETPPTVPFFKELAITRQGRRAAFRSPTDVEYHLITAGRASRTRAPEFQ